jgi:hypothetical protein
MSGLPNYGKHGIDSVTVYDRGRDVNTNSADDSAPINIESTLVFGIARIVAIAQSRSGQSRLSWVIK